MNKKMSFYTIKIKSNKFKMFTLKIIFFNDEENKKLNFTST